MKINRDEPLPDHTKLDYDECCALLILRDLFPTRYSDLRLVDKPDLQSGRVGVEVTIADDRGHREAINNWVKANNCADERKRQKYVERMSQLGVKYTGGIQSWPGYNPTFELVQEAITVKAEKMRRGNYSVFDKNELFVFTDARIDEDTGEKAMTFFEREKLFTLFDRIYILEKGYLLYIFTADGCKCVEIDISEQTERNILARRMVERAEE